VPTADRHSYDAVPYASAPTPAAHVARLESLAALAGMTPAPPASARVLELGCGTGANLLRLALDYPHATFVGCDLARSAIASARDRADQLRIGNLVLREADLADVDRTWGEFDYILCHDVFSWVPPETRARILEICTQHLATNGVGFISYDALPGWRLHGVAREIMRYHTRHLDGWRDVVAQARAVLAMAAAAQDRNRSAYASLVKDEYSVFSAIPDEQLYHVVSTAHHQAFYFHEFVEQIQGAALQWLGNAGAGTLWPCGIAPAFLRDAPPHEQQQYADFFDNCTFRGSLVCHERVALSRPDDGVLRRLWIGLTAGTIVEPVSSSGSLRLAVNGRELGTFDATIGAGLRRLDEARPALLPCAQVFDPHLPLPAEFLVSTISRGALEAVLTPFNVSYVPGEFPTASPLVRLQARHDSVVTNQRSEPVRVDGLTRHVVQLLDGSRDRRSLAAALARRIESGPIHDDGELVLLDTAAHPADLIEDVLGFCRDHALLIPGRA
jgi:SAM-dependent methyltransferase